MRPIGRYAMPRPARQRASLDGFSTRGAALRAVGLRRDRAGGGGRARRAGEGLALPPLRDQGAALCRRDGAAAPADGGELTRRSRRGAPRPSGSSAGSRDRGRGGCASDEHASCCAPVEDEALGSGLPEAKDADAGFVGSSGSALRLLREGMGRGSSVPRARAHALHRRGATLHHFATGRFGEELIGRSLFAPSEVRRHKTELLELIRHGLVAVPPTRAARPRRRP